MDGAENAVEEWFVGWKRAGDDGGGAFDGGPEGGGGGGVGWVEGGEVVDGEEAEDGGYADAMGGFVSFAISCWGGREHTMRQAETCLR